MKKKYTLLTAFTNGKDNQLTNYGIPITNKEKIFLGSNSLFGSIGTTTGIITEALWFATSSIGSGGLGVALTGAFSLLMLGFTGIISLVVALPISVIAYKDLISEAKHLNEELKTKILQRKKLQEKIFFELLLLRCQQNNNTDFLAFIKNKRLDKRFIKLANLVNKAHEQLNQSTYHVDYDLLKHIPIIDYSNKKTDYSLNQLLLDRSHHLRDSFIQKDIMRKIKDNDENFSAKVSDCFDFTPSPPTTSQNKEAYLHGLTAALTISGCSLGTGWAFGSIVVCAGISSLAVPFLGWVIFGISCLVLGIVFGIGTALCRQKNVGRNAINQDLHKDNQHLKKIHDELKIENNSFFNINNKPKNKQEHSPEPKNVFNATPRNENNNQHYFFQTPDMTIPIRHANESKPRHSI